MDLLGLRTPAPSVAPVSDGGLFGGSSAATQAGNAAYTPAKTSWLNASQGKGLDIKGTFARTNGSMQLLMTFINRSPSPMADFAIQLDKNSFGVIPGELTLPLLQPNESKDVTVVLNLGGTVQVSNPLTSLKVAVKNNYGVNIFSTEMPVHIFFVEDGRFDRNEFLNSWKELPENNECKRSFNGLSVTKDTIKNILEANNVFVIAERLNEQMFYYCSIKFTNNLVGLIEISTSFAGSVQIAVKSRSAAVIELICNAIGNILCRTTPSSAPAPSPFGTFF